MSTLNLSKSSMSVAEELKKICGEDVARCYQCGKCTAGCPIAEEADLAPNQVVRLVQIGQPDPALESEAIWLCLGCETCTARCPQKVDLAGMMDALREMAAKKNPAKASKRIVAFHRAFLDQIKAFGRVPEFTLIGDYKMRTGAFFQDILLAPSMAMKGKIRMVPERVKGVKEVRKIFDRCMAEGQRREK